MFGNSSHMLFIPEKDDKLKFQYYFYNFKHAMPRQSDALAFLNMAPKILMTTERGSVSPPIECREALINKTW